MISYNFRYELKLLLRNRWIQLLSLLLLLLFGFSTFNGKEKVAKRQAIIDAAILEVQENDQMMLKLLDSIEKGMSVNISRWTIPTNPMAVGNYHPRVAAMQPQSLAFVATGQADVFTHYVKPKVTGDDLALNFSEMTSPVQLLFGSFDLAFVIIYLLPLIIIAFSYDVLSSEKENGTFKLLAAQPIGIQTWILQKLALRFFWMSILVLVSLLLVFLILGIDWSAITPILPKLTVLILSYMLFWFGLAFLVNLWGTSSSKNAISLLGLWVSLVLLVPSVLNQFSTTLYPIPSRTLMINDMRSLKAEATKKQNEILDNYLRDHPEYAINDTTQTRSFYHRYMASQSLVKEQLEPIVNRYENQLKKQQGWLNNFKWISPAIIVQESLNSMAGTSTLDYENFRKQVIVFAQTWRDTLTPFLYNNQSFSQKDYEKLPQFTYKPKSYTNSMTSIILLLVTCSFLGIGFLSSKDKFLFKAV